MEVQINRAWVKEAFAKFLEMYERYSNVTYEITVGQKSGDLRRYYAKFVSYDKQVLTEEVIACMDHDSYRVAEADLHERNSYDAFSEYFYGLRRSIRDYLASRGWDVAGYGDGGWSLLYVRS